MFSAATATAETGMSPAAVAIAAGVTAAVAVAAAMTAAAVVAARVWLNSALST